MHVFPAHPFSCCSESSGNRSDGMDTSWLLPSSSLTVSQYFILSHNLICTPTGWKFGILLHHTGIKVDDNLMALLLFLKRAANCLKLFISEVCNSPSISLWYPHKKNLQCNMLPSTIWWQLFLASILLILRSKCAKRSREWEQEGGGRRRDVSQSTKLNE